MSAKSLSEINNRRDLEDVFQAAMSSAHHTLSALSHFEREQNLPKSYLIEFHPKWDEHCHHDWTREAIFSALNQSGPRYGASVRRTKDDSLLFLGHNEQKYSAEFIIDCLNPRFIVLHTLSNATVTDRFIFERLTQYQPEFDLFWFPVSLLEHVVTRERVTGWEAHFNPLLGVDEFVEERSESGIESESSTRTDEAFNEVETEPRGQALPQPRISMRFEQPDALNTYKELARITSLLPDLPLNGVLAERENEQAKTSARARIKSNGKITGRGVDFPAYLQIVNGMLDMYAEIVHKLESSFWIKLMPYERRGEALQFGTSGEPFCIRFKREVNIKRLIDLMFGCKRPFRLMGEAEQLAEDYFAVDAIDLHVNQPLAFEIAPKLMRIYLYEGTCGNTLVRIIRSLQHHIDSNLQHPPLVELLGKAWH